MSNETSTGLHLCPKPRVVTSLFSSLLLAVLLALPAAAQQTQSEEEEETPLRPLSTIEEITVTATKREASIQAVPIAISAFTGEDLQARGIEDLEDLQQVAPSLTVYNSNTDSNGGTLRIRGMGTTGNNPGLEAAVGSFVDGVYRSRSGLAYGDLLDVERIEILRGPQGTLFGKNTSAGAVHIITKKPDFDYGATASFSVGNFNLERGMLSVTGPLIDEQLAFRLAGSFNQREGYYDDIGSSDKFNDRDRFNLKGQLLWIPRDDLDVRIIYDYSEKDESCCPAVWRQVGPTGAISAALGGTVPSPVGTQNPHADSLDVGTNFDPFEDAEEQGLSIEANWDLEWARLTALTAWRDFEWKSGQDIDFTDTDILLPQDTDAEFLNFSQELRVQGIWESVDWLVGGYYFHERHKNDADVRVSTQGAAFVGEGLLGLDPDTASEFYGVGAGYSEAWDQNSQGWSLFTHNVWHITEQLSLTLGYRWNYEKKEGTGVINGAPYDTIINEPHCGIVPIPSLCNNFSWKRRNIEREPSGTVSLAYQLTDEINAYLGYSRGYKAGGFNLDQEALDLAPDGSVVDLTVFEPEHADAYELGVKAQMFDNRLTVNTALFYTQFENFQLNTFTGLGFFISNLPEVTARGVELESFFTLTDGVYGSAGVTYAITRYANNMPGNESIEGQRITHAPRVTGSASIFAEREVPGTGWISFVNSNVAFRSEHNTGSSLTRGKRQNSLWLLNGQVGVRSPDDRWELALWGTNLTDKRYDTIVFDSVFQGGSLSTFMGAPRMWGVTVTSRY